MKSYISEGRAAYEDYNHGNFSKRLAEWAISRMKAQDTASEKMKPIKAVSLEDTKEILKTYGIKIAESCIYTAWYLYNMSIADYPKSLKTDEQRAYFVSETINDPDSMPEAVLECFVAKMCTVGEPIYWENYL